MNILDEMQSITDEEYFRALYQAQKLKTPQENFSDWVKSEYVSWIYKHFRIGNGDMLLTRMEDMQTQEAFIKDYGLPEDTEL